MKPHEYFKRQGTDILYEAPLSFAEAALGTEVEITTLDGKESLKIPAGMPDEQVLFLSDIFPTGYMAAENAEIEPGETVAVWGCGPSGSSLSRALGCSALGG